MLGKGDRQESEELAADDFATFFRDKVEAVRSTTSATPPHDVTYKSMTTINEWAEVTADEVEAYWLSTQQVLSLGPGSYVARERHV